MLGRKFRPWGELEWILSKTPQQKWSLIGCLSTEDRFVSTLSLLTDKNCLDKVLFFQIIDPQSRDTNIIKNIHQDNLKVFLDLKRTANEVKQFGLLEPHSNIISELNGFLANTNGNIILDISTLPKRYFIPIIKVLLKSKLLNLIVTYSTPKFYAKGDLSSNPESWSHLPLFGPITHPEPPVNLAIVGVGFMPFGLPKLLLGKYNSATVKLLFPFPPGPPNYQRTWEFVREIEQSYRFKTSDSIIKIDSNNTCDAYDYIMFETANGSKNTIFAPYGPKPISLAMCLFACKYNSSIYYTQPHHYNPYYSVGRFKTFGYNIMINSELLY